LNSVKGISIELCKRYTVLNVQKAKYITLNKSIHIRLCKSLHFNMNLWRPSRFILYKRHTVLFCTKGIMILSVQKHNLLYCTKAFISIRQCKRHIIWYCAKGIAYYIFTKACKELEKNEFDCVKVLYKRINNVLYCEKFIAYKTV
jgi:hypothetical protein